VFFGRRDRRRNPPMGGVSFEAAFVASLFNLMRRQGGTPRDAPEVTGRALAFTSAPFMVFEATRRRGDGATRRPRLRSLLPAEASRVVMRPRTADVADHGVIPAKSGRRTKAGVHGG
jgi:hypothetical protein